MMTEFLSQLVYWHWLVLGLVLIGVEMFAPGMFIMWPGFAALVIGLLYLVCPTIGGIAAVTLWAVLSVASVLGWIAWRKKHPAAPTGDPTLNRRGEQYVGRQFTLANPIINGRGELRVDDTVWRVVSNDDLPAGAQVTVTAVEGTSLRVNSSLTP